MDEVRSLAARAGCPVPTSRAGVPAFVNCVAPKAIIAASALDAIASVLLAVL